MTTSDVVNLVGLGFGTVGGIFLAYDVVYGPGKRWQAEVIAAKLQNLRWFRHHIRESTKALPRPPYTDEEIKALLDEEEKRWGPEEASLASQNDTFIDRHENRVVTLGATGVLMLVVSFVLQFIAVLIPKPGT